MSKQLRRGDVSPQSRSEFSSGPELWARVLEVAASTMGDRLRTEHLTLDSFDGRTLRLLINDSGRDIARYLTREHDKLAELVKRATGQEVTIVLEAPPESPGYRASNGAFGSQTPEYQQLASSLSDRLKALEIKLRNRPGQMQAEVRFGGAERDHRLCWHRHGGEWMLWVWDVPTEREAVDESDGKGFVTGLNGRPLLNCSLDEKIAATEVIPSLLQSIKDAESGQIARLRSAHHILNLTLREIKAGGDS